MVNCQEFKEWLIDQDSADEDATRRIVDHIEVCQTCEALYQTDATLETVLKTGMQTVEPTPGLIAVPFDTPMNGLLLSPSMWQRSHSVFMFCEERCMVCLLLFGNTVPWGEVPSVNSPWQV